MVYKAEGYSQPLIGSYKTKISVFQFFGFGLNLPLLGMNQQIHNSATDAVRTVFLKLGVATHLCVAKILQCDAKI